MCERGFNGCQKQGERKIWGNLNNTVFYPIKKNPNVVNFTRKQRKHPYSIVTQDGETQKKQKL